MFCHNLPEKSLKMGYIVKYAPEDMHLPPSISKNMESTTSWRDAKKALRSWYLDEAKALRSVTEKEYFKND